MRERFVLYIMILLIIPMDVFGATIHGVVYDSVYQTVDDTLLEINTTPKQNHVSKNGAYFFYAPVGTFEIVVEKYYQKQLVYSAKKIVDISKDGEFQIDIVVEKVADVNIPDKKNQGPSLFAVILARYGWMIKIALIVFGIILLVLAGIYLYWFIKKKRKISFSVDKDTTSFTKEIDSISTVFSVGKNDSEDSTVNCDTVMKIIKDEGGRTTQKEIRKKIPLSEAKISLMVSELEAAGKIQKIKKGRGNIIVLR